MFSDWRIGLATLGILLGICGLIIKDVALCLGFILSLSIGIWLFIDGIKAYKEEKKKRADDIKRGN